MSNGGSNDWFVFVDGGDHVGPVTIDLLARGLAAGKVSKEAQVARGRAAEWRPVLTFPELVAAIDEMSARDPGALPPLVPDPPLTEPEMTEVMRRDDEMAKAFSALDKKRSSSGPPKPPLAPRRSHPDLGPRSVSGAPSAPRVPSVPPMAPISAPPSAPLPNAADLFGPTGAPLPPPAAPPQRLPMQSSPPPPVAPPPMFAPPGDMLGAPRPPMQSAPPPNVAPQPPFPPAPPPLVPSAPPPNVAPAMLAPSAPPLPIVAPVVEAKKEEKKDAPKPPAVDPKLSLIVPLGMFAIFVFLSLVVTVYALITKSYQ